MDFIIKIKSQNPSHPSLEHIFLTVSLSWTPSPSLRPRPSNHLHSNPTRFGAPRPAPPGSHPRLPLPFAPLPCRRHTCRPWGRRSGRTRPANRFPAVVSWRVGARLGCGLSARPLLRGRGLSSHRRCRGGLAPTYVPPLTLCSES